MGVETKDYCSITIVNLEKVKTVQQQLPDGEKIQALADTFKALSDPTRIQILMALAIEEMCVCDLAALINLSVSAVSHQLRLLRNLKLVKYRREGKMAYYSLDDDHIEVLIHQAQEHVNERA